MTTETVNFELSGNTVRATYYDVVRRTTTNKVIFTLLFLLGLLPGAIFYLIQDYRLEKALIGKVFDLKTAQSALRWGATLGDIRLAKFVKMGSSQKIKNFISTNGSPSDAFKFIISQVAFHQTVFSQNGEFARKLILLRSVAERTVREQKPLEPRIHWAYFESLRGAQGIWTLHLSVEEATKFKTILDAALPPSHFPQLNNSLELVTLHTEK